MDPFVPVGCHKPNPDLPSQAAPEHGVGAEVTNRSHKLKITTTFAFPGTQGFSSQAADSEEFIPPAEFSFVFDTLLTEPQRCLNILAKVLEESQPQIQKRSSDVSSPNPTDGALSKAPCPITSGRFLCAESPVAKGIQ